MGMVTRSAEQWGWMEEDVDGERVESYSSSSSSSSSSLAMCVGCAREASVPSSPPSVTTRQEVDGGGSGCGGWKWHAVFSGFVRATSVEDGDTVSSLRSDSEKENASGLSERFLNRRVLKRVGAEPAIRRRVSIGRLSSLPPNSWIGGTGKYPPPSPPPEATSRTREFWSSCLDVGDSGQSSVESSVSVSSQLIASFLETALVRPGGSERVVEGMPLMVPSGLFEG